MFDLLSNCSAPSQIEMRSSSTFFSPDDRILISALYPSFHQHHHEQLHHQYEGFHREVPTFCNIFLPSWEVSCYKLQNEMNLNMGEIRYCIISMNIMIYNILIYLIMIFIKRKGYTTESTNNEMRNSYTYLHKTHRINHPINIYTAPGS